MGEDDDPIALVNIRMEVHGEAAAEFYSRGGVISYFSSPASWLFLREVYGEAFTGPFMLDKTSLKAF